MKKIKTWFGKTTTFAKTHKIITTIIVLVVAFAGYKTYQTIAAGNVTPQYLTAQAHLGSITQTVTGSGQISAENQLDVTSQVSGTVKSIDVAVGDHVTTGQLLATIDAHDALISLQNAQLSYAKATAPAKTGDLANANNSVTKSYNDAFNSVASTFVDLPTVMSGLNSLFYTQGGFLGDAHATTLNTTARAMRDDSGVSFDAAARQYAVVLQEYASLDRQSATGSLDKLITDTSSLLKSISDALQKTKITVNFVIANQPDYYAHDSGTAASNLNTWIGTINSDISSLLGGQSSITSAANSLNTITTMDPLDLQSQQLALQQAQETYAKYFIRAPFDGIVGRLPVSIYSSAGGSTVIATVVGDQKIATISLNEVDAAKVAVGQPVAITFDAIDDFTATGTVKQVDLVGTVSQGVVSYSVKIAINTVDSRIKPGMSLNTTITTKQADNVLVVPAAAVKTQGSISYVQVLDASAMTGTAPAGAAAGTTRGAGRFGSTTGQFRGTRTASSTDATTTGMYASTTRAYTGTGTRTFTGTASAQQVTVSTSATPVRVNVTVGDSDDTNIQVLSGLKAGDVVIVRTIAAGTATTATTPSILSGIGNRGGAAGATTRTTGAAGAARTGNATFGR